MNAPIVLTKLNREEALRYMGQSDGKCNEQLETILDVGEEKLLQAAQPKYLYKVFDITPAEQGIALCNTSFVLQGQDIKNHLMHCEKAVLLCATLSAGVDALIRREELRDVLLALAVDCLASTAVEQLCDKVELLIKEQFLEYEMTWRYGIGYGDLPISQQRDFLNLLNAPKHIGLNVTQSNILTPRKSVTAIIGLSKEKIEQTKRGCAVCNLRETCQLRKKGSRCNV